MKKEKQTSCMQKGPGPGRYGLPPLVGYRDHDFTKDKRPAYSMAKRYPFMEKERSPGPAYLIPPKVTRTGVDGIPEYTTAMRYEDPDQFITPAANAYHNERVHPQGEKQAPEYTMRARTRYKRTDCNPAPNKYTMPAVLGAPQAHKKTPPCYSMRKQLKVGCFAEDLVKGPGPGCYTATDASVVRDKAPIYSLRERIEMPHDTTTKPGPAAHYREKVVVNMPRAPAYSMGVKHTPCATILLSEKECSKCA